MNKRKLLIGLTSAAFLMAGFGGTVLEASAEQVYEVTLIGGARVKVTVPAGQTLAEVAPGATDPVLLSESPAPDAPAPGPDQPATREGLS